MKKISIFLTLLLLSVNTSYSVVKLDLSMRNPGVENGFFKMDVFAAVMKGQVWRIGSTNIRITWTTNNSGCVSIHTESNPSPSCPNHNYTTTSIS